MYRYISISISIAEVANAQDFTLELRRSTSSERYKYEKKIHSNSCRSVDIKFFPSMSEYFQPLRIYDWYKSLKISVDLQKKNRKYDLSLKIWPSKDFRIETINHFDSDFRKFWHAHIFQNYTASSVIWVVNHISTDNNFDLDMYEIFALRSTLHEKTYPFNVLWFSERTSLMEIMIPSSFSHLSSEWNFLCLPLHVRLSILWHWVAESCTEVKISLRTLLIYVLKAQYRHDGLKREEKMSFCQMETDINQCTLTSREDTFCSPEHVEIRQHTFYVTDWMIRNLTETRNCRTIRLRKRS